MPGSPFQRIPLVTRFWAKVDRGAPHQCWNWIGATTTRRHGGSLYVYGNIRDDAPSSKVLLTHRVALALAEAEATGKTLAVILAEHAREDACHRCDNTRCCNPRHLVWGSHRWNMLDYVKKYGRLGVGKDTPDPPRPSLPFEEPAHDDDQPDGRA